MDETTPDTAAPPIRNRTFDETAIGDGAAVMMGAGVPIVLISRADSRESRIASCALAALVARHYRRSPP